MYNFLEEVRVNRSKNLNLISLGVNIFVILFVFIAWYFMYFTTGDGVYEDTGFALLKFFSILSNIYMGVVAIVMVIFQAISYFKQKNVVPVWASLLYMSGVVAVDQTFLVVALYMAPLDVVSGLGYFHDYLGCLFFFHFVVPVLATLDFCILNVEPKIDFKWIFFSSAASLAYAVFYGVNYYAHFVHTTRYGAVDYDWYQLMGDADPLRLIVVLLVMGLMLVLIVLGLWAWNEFSRHRLLGYDPKEGQLFIPGDDMDAEIVEDTILGHVGDTEEVKVPQEEKINTNTIKIKYTTNTGMVHVVTKRLKNKVNVNSSYSNYGSCHYHIFKKAFHKKWCCQSVIQPGVLEYHLFDMKDDALDYAIVESKKTGGTIRIQERKKNK